MNRLLYVPMLLAALSANAAQANIDKNLKQKYQDVILESMPEQKPDWMTEGDLFFEKDGFVFIVSEGDNADGYPLAQRIAKAGAMHELIEAIQTKATGDLGRCVERFGLDTNKEFIKDTVALISQNITVNDFTASKVYKQKVLKRPSGQVRYQVFALYSIPLVEYRNAKARALTKMQEQAAKAQNAQAEQTAKVLLDDLAKSDL